MGKLMVFNHVTLDGYFTDANGDMSWAHRSDPESVAFAAENAGKEGMILFGRKTYEMMASFWPTPQAAAAMPAVAERMNARPKVVVSRTMGEAAWRNTRVVKENLVEAVRALKAESATDIVVLGSGSVVAQLAEARLVDQVQVVVNPIALGKGRTMFEGLSAPYPLTRTSVRTFASGNVLVVYDAVLRS